MAAPPLPPFEPSRPSVAVFAPLILLTLMLIGAAVLSPRVVRWPRVAAELDAHQSDLAVLAFGVAGVTFALFAALFFGQLTS
jgi:hypothetical protein